ncbi:MAG: hypothetical protein KJ072_11060 [Verrucomicrobia bacterium]|nr:hypothetical protein [Verrucomicrobiota bacterium]
MAHSAPHFVSLLSGLGLVRCAGSNNAGESVPPTWLRNVIAVGAANEVSLAVTTLSLREEPGDVGALAGAGITLAVDAIGAEPISYQWYRDGQPIPGALNPTLHIAQSTTADSGTYTVTVSNPFATLASRPASVAILNAEWPLMEWGNLLLTADGFLTAAARVEPGRTYDLLVSSDLTNWIPLQTIVADQSVWLIREQPHPDVPVLFFRLMLVP